MSARPDGPGRRAHVPPPERFGSRQPDLAGEYWNISIQKREGSRYAKGRRRSLYDFPGAHTNIRTRQSPERERRGAGYPHFANVVTGRIVQNHYHYYQFRIIAEEVGRVCV